MDKTKYLMPRYSETLEPLVDFLRDRFGDQTTDQNSSTINTDLSMMLDNKSEFSMRMASTKSNTLTKLALDSTGPSHIAKQRSHNENSQQERGSDLISQHPNMKEQLPPKHHNNNSKDQKAPKFNEQQLVLEQNFQSYGQPSHSNKSSPRSLLQNQDSTFKKTIQSANNYPLNSQSHLQGNISRLMQQNYNIIEAQEEEYDDDEQQQYAKVTKSTTNRKQEPFKNIEIGIRESERKKVPSRMNGFVLQNLSNQSSRSKKTNNSESLHKRKYASQPRGALILNSTTGGQELLPDISVKKSQMFSGNPMKKRKLSSISSQSSSRSLRALLDSSPTSQHQQEAGTLRFLRNQRKSLQRRQTKNSSSSKLNHFILHDKNYNSNNNNKYLRNIMRLDDQQQQQEQNYADEGENEASFAKQVEQKEFRVKRKGKKAKKSLNVSVNKHMIQHSFISPLRASNNITSAAVPTQGKREMSSSPYLQKKRSEKVYLNKDYREEDLNKLMSFQVLNDIEDQERKYLDILEGEKLQMKKKEQASREIIAEFSKKLKQSQKRVSEESKVAQELKRRHDFMKKKMEKATKDKQENISQLKSLYALFTQQRKALEISIAKTKKLEEEQTKFELRYKNIEDINKNQVKRIEQLEQERDQLYLKHKREKEQLESEIEEKRTLVKRYENEFKDISNQKILMKKQLDEYELKIKKLILEFEESSKKHIRELNEVHEQYRGYKAQSLEAESRIKQYKEDQLKAMQSEREAKKEVHVLRLENDELRERLRFAEQKHLKLIKRMGASQEDLKAIDEQMIQRAEQLIEEDDEAQFIKKAGAKNHPFQKIVDVRQVKNDSIQIEDYEDILTHNVVQDQRQKTTGSRLDRRRGEIDSIMMEQQQQQQNQEIVDSYQYYGEQNEDADSDNQVQQDKKKARSNKKAQSHKKTNIEVLDDERPIEQYYEQHKQHQSNPSNDDSEQGLLKKLIENITGNPALQNQYIRDQFKLDLIQSEGDLHEYKNLLNSMAALFYTNHRMNDVTELFFMWKEAAALKLKEKVLQESMEQQQKQQKQKAAKIAPPAGIQIDTELANQEVFYNYQNKNDSSYIMPEMEQQEEEDNVLDLEQRDFIEDLKKVGPASKQILNYTYPPLLYQRGDEDEDEDEDGEQDEDESENEMQDNQLPDLADFEDEDAHNHDALGNNQDDDDDDDDDDDIDIQDLINGGNIPAGFNNEDLYAKLKNVAKDKGAQQYVEQVDEDGNVYLMEAEEDDYGFEDEMSHQIIDGDIDDEEFMQMMEEEALRQRNKRQV